MHSVILDIKDRLEKDGSYLMYLYRGMVFEE